MPPRPATILVPLFAMIAGLAASTTAHAQPQLQDLGRDPNVLEAFLPMAPPGQTTFRVTRVGPGGTIGLEIGPAIPAESRRFVGLSEGFQLLVVPADAKRPAPLVLRVQVTDIAEGGVLTLQTSREAAERLKTGDGAFLVRPFNATTARLRALPALIPSPATAAPGAVGDAIASARTAAQRARSVNNLKQIGLALHNFHSTHDQFPPAVIFGPDGKPWHSWRVLLLPYLEQVSLYNAYDFSQPWDSPKNRKLLDQKMPDVYREPAYGNARESFTHYAALVGARAAFKPDGARQTDPKNPPLGKGGVGLRDITDGTSNSVAVVPVSPARKVPWTKPEDINVGPEFPGLPKPGTPQGIATPYTVDNKPGGAGDFPALFLDGSVLNIAATTNDRTLDALFTIAGGEVVSRDSFTSSRTTSPRPFLVLRIRIEGARATATIE